MRNHLYLLLLCLGFVLAGCPDDDDDATDDDDSTLSDDDDATGDDDDATGDDDDATGDDDDSAGDDDDSAVEPPISFSEVYTTLLSQRCSCHDGGAHSTGFFMNGSATTAYGNLVGVAAFELATMSRIAAGDPDNSYLVNKIQGTAGTVGGSNASQMPLVGGPLSQGDIDYVRAWVTGGALP